MFKKKNSFFKKGGKFKWWIKVLFFGVLGIGAKKIFQNLKDKKNKEEQSTDLKIAKEVNLNQDARKQASTILNSIKKKG